MNAAGDDSLVGGSGNDFIVATQGSDTLEGGDGADTLMGGTQGDSLDGGSDDDLLLGDLAGVTFNATGFDGVGVASGINDFPTTELTYEITFSTTADPTAQMALASYWVSGEDNELLLQSFGGELQVTLAGNADVATGIPTTGLFDGDIHTVGLTWDSATGALEVYVDRVSAYSGTYATGTTLDQNGTFAIGQEQDADGGGFDTNQLFEGTIYGVCLYDDIRSPWQMLDTTHAPIADTTDANLIANWVADPDSSSFTDQTGNHAMTMSGNRSSTWSEDADTLSGGSGADTIFGGGGDDSIYGGADNDVIDGGEGADYIEGQGGDDILTYAVGGDTLDGGDGADTLHGGFTQGTDDAVLIGGAGNDSIVTYGADDTLFGDSGDDLLVGDSGNELFWGGADADTVYAGFGADAVLGGAGADSIEGDAGFDRIQGGTGNDTVAGGAGQDRFYTQGNNLLENGSFELTSTNGLGQELAGWTLAGTEEAGVLSNPARASDGDQTMSFGGWSANIGAVLRQTVETTPGETYTLTFTLGATQGTADQELLVVLNDGAAPDGWIATAPAGTVQEFTFTYTATTASTTLTFTHSDGEEGDADLDDVRLVAGTPATDGDDSVSGGDDEDTFFLSDGFGSDTLVGGEGGTDGDTIDLGALQGAVTATFTGDEAGTITDGTDTLTFSEIEALALSDQDDFVDGRSVTSTGTASTIDAGAGGDTVYGTEGTDSVLGGSGDDYIDGWSSDDTIEGGEGADSVHGGSGDDSVSGGAGDDDVTGHSGADTLTGGAGNDYLEGGTGADSIEGGDDADTIALKDGFGADTITGGEGGVDADVLNLDAFTTSGVTVEYSGTEAGSVTDGADTLAFSEIEQFVLSDQDDSVGADLATGATQFDGGLGRDSLDVGGLNYTGEAGFSGTITDAGFTLTNGTDTISGTNFESFYLSDGGDTVDASAVTTDLYIFGRDGSYNGINDDVIISGSGNDTIHSADGHAVMTGGAGDDSFFGINGDKSFLFEDGFGNDSIDASTGRDEVNFSGLSAQTVQITMTDGANGVVTSGSDSVLLYSISSATFDAFTLGGNTDSFNATGSADAFDVAGGLGDDTLIGGDGNDTLAGGDGDDLIEGGDGADFLKTG